LAQSKPVRQAFAIAANKHGGEEREAVAGKHPGFDAVAGRIAKRRNPRTGKPYGKERARAILAAASRKASPAARRRNPRLRRV
jgi:hypothetical protein